MGVARREPPVPDPENAPVKLSYRNLASIASHGDALNLNLTYEYRNDANGQNVFARKREGATVLSSLAAAGTQVGRGIYSWRPTSRTTDWLIFALDNGSNVTLYVESSGVATTTSQTLTTGKEVFFVPVFAFNGTTTVEKLMVFNGTDAVLTWDGATATTTWATLAVGAPLSTTVGGLAVFHNNMLFVAKNNRVYISGVGTPTSAFTASNALDFPGAITALTTFDNFVVVFTRDSISQLWGFSPTQMVVSAATQGRTERNRVIGCDGPRSVARVGDWLYFWSHDRFYRWNTASIEEVAYDKLRSTIDTIVETNSSAFAATEFKDRYVCAVTYSSGSSNNRVLVYDPRVEEWTVHSGPTVHSFAKYRSSQDATPTLVYVTNSGASRTPKVFTYNGSTTPIDVLTSNTLNGNHTATATTITLTSAAEFPTSGTIMIESEIITYTGKSTNDLTGCTRGSNGTTAAAHASTTAVSLVELITFQYTTHHLDHGDSHLIKKNKYLFFNTKGYGSAADMRVQAAVDYGDYADVLTFDMNSGGFVLDSSTLDDTDLGSGTLSTTSARRLSLPASRTISLRFHDTNGVGQTELYDIDFQYSARKLKLT